MKLFVKMALKFSMGYLVAHEAELEAMIDSADAKVVVRAACAACAELQALLK